MKHRREMQLVSCLIVLFAMAIPIGVLAQADDSTVQPSSNPHFDQDRSMDSIAEQDLFEKQAATTPQALKHMPGVYLQEPFRGAGSLSVRGMTGSRNLILIDGIRYTNAIYGTFPNQYLAGISPFALSGATVLRGPSSVRFGNGGMGGVISLTTKSLEGMPNGGHGGGRFFYASGDHTSGAVAEGGYVSDTYSLLTGADYTGFGEVRAGGGDKQPFTNYERANWRARILLSPVDSPLTVTGNYMGHFTNDAMRTDRLGVGDIRSTDNSDNLVYVSLDWKPVQALKRLGIRASYHQMTEEAQQNMCPVVGGKSRIDYHSCTNLDAYDAAYRYREVVDTFGLISDMELLLVQDRIQISGAIEYYFDNLMSTRSEARDVSGSSVFVDQSRGLYSSGAYYSQFGTFLHADAAMLKTRAGDLHLTLGGRFSNFSGYAPLVPGDEEAQDIHYSHSGFMGSASIQWFAKDIFNLYGTFSQGFRSPTLQESTALGYVGSEFQVPNTELDPERAYNFEVGSRLNIAPVEVALAWFHNSVDDYIDEQPGIWLGRNHTSDGTPIIQRVNADEAVFQGVESTVAIHLFNVTVSADITWVEGEVKDETEGYFGQLVNYATHFPVRHMPSLYGSGAIRYDDANQRFYAELSVDWADTQSRLHPMDKQALRTCEDGYHTGVLDPDCKGVDGWYTLNLRGGFKVTDHARVELAALNLNDARYQPVGSGFYAPGFDARGTLIVNF